MASYAQLKVFKEAYDLLMLVYQSTANISREYRYTLVEKIKNDVTELCILIYRANLTKEGKALQIDVAREMLIRIALQCRMLGDLRQISAKLTAQLTLHTQSISAQLDAWHKYSTDKEEK